MFGLKLYIFLVIFTYLKLWIAVARHNFKWVKKFHPLEIVSRWRDPQLQVSEHYSDLTKWRSTVFSNIGDWCHILSSTCLKGGTYYNVLIKNENPNIYDIGG